MERYVSLDFETANDDFSSICQVGIATLQDNKIYTFSSYIDPEDIFTNTWLHGIDEDTVKGAPKFPEIIDKINDFIGDNIVISYGGFDRAAFIQVCEKYNLKFPEYKWINAHRIVRRHYKQFSERGYNLDNISNFLSINNDKHHDAENDAIVCLKIVEKILCESEKNLSWWNDRIKRPISTERYDGLPEQDINIDGDLYGQTILFTGELNITRKEATILANKSGAKVVNTPSKKVNYLVVGNQDLKKIKGDMSNKHKKILELNENGCNINIIKEDDFKVLIQNDYTPTKIITDKSEEEHSRYELVTKNIDCNGFGITVSYYDKN